MACNVTTMKKRYLREHASRNLSDAELLKFEKEVNSISNKILNFFGHGDMLTPREVARLQKLHAPKPAAKPQTKPAEKKMDSSIWTMEKR